MAPLRRDSPEGASAVLAAYLERRADLVRFFALRLRSASAAEDLVQDIYLRLVAIDAGTQVHNPVGYLYRLGSNLMLDSLRGQHRTAARDASWRDTHSTFVGAEEVAEQPDAEQAIAARQRLDAVVVALRDCPSKPSGSSGCTSSTA